MCQLCLIRFAITQSLGAATGDPAHGAVGEVKDADLVCAGIGEIKLILGQRQIPRGGKVGFPAHGLTGLQGQATLAGTGDGADRVGVQVDHPDRMVAGIGDIDRAVTADQPLRAAETGTFCRAVNKSTPTVAIALDLLAMIVQQDNLAVTAIGQRPVALAIKGQRLDFGRVAQPVMWCPLAFGIELHRFDQALDLELVEHVIDRTQHLVQVRLTGMHADNRALR